VLQFPPKSARWFAILGFHVTGSLRCLQFPPKSVRLFAILGCHYASRVHIRVQTFHAHCLSSLAVVVGAAVIVIRIDHRGKISDSSGSGRRSSSGRSERHEQSCRLSRAIFYTTPFAARVRAAFADIFATEEDDDGRRGSHPRPRPHVLAASARARWPWREELNAEGVPFSVAESEHFDGSEEKRLRASHLYIIQTVVSYCTIVAGSFACMSRSTSTY